MMDFFFEGSLCYHCFAHENWNGGSDPYELSGPGAETGEGDAPQSTDTGGVIPNGRYLIQTIIYIEYIICIDNQAHFTFWK